MVMPTASIRTRSIQAEQLSAATDRLVNLALRPGVVDPVAGGGPWWVGQDTGANMQIKVGSGAPYDRAVVEGSNPGQGVYVLQHDNASVALPVAASDPANPRKDIVVLRVYDDVFDSSGKNFADVEVIQGVPNVSPVEPAVPGSALKLAVIDVAAGATAVTSGDITDTRPRSMTRGQLAATVVYTASGTFNKADWPGLSQVRVRVQGGGGAGGGCVATGSTGVSAGAGGSGGAYAEKLIPAASLAASEAVTVGAGGAGVAGATGGNGGSSSFGSHCSAAGGFGAGGVANTASGTVDVFRGSVGQPAGTGDIVVAGGGGGFALVSRAGIDRAASGIGGSSALGGGGRAVTTSLDGEPGLGYGAGGSGASNLPSQPARPGGDGGPGLVVVEVFV